MTPVHQENVPATVQVKPVCKFCGCDEGFREYGFVRVEATRDLRSLKRTDDGKLKPSWGFVDDDLADGDDFEPDGVECRACGREEARIEDLVGPPIQVEPGAVVVCPDGLRGLVATVDNERRTLTVEGWHEEFKFAEVSGLAVAA